MDNLKSVCLLWQILARQFHTSQQSIDTFNRRVDNESIRFLITDLSLLGKAFDRALITGEPFHVEGRFGLKRSTVLPEFLYEHFSQVFDQDGVLLDDDSMLAHIKAIRQLCLICYKTKVPYSEDTVKEAIEGFLTRDKLCAERLRISRASYRKARSLIARVLSGVDPLDITPRHGPGATSCRTENHDKWHSFRFIPRLNAVYEYSEFFFASPTHLCDNLHKLLHSDELEGEPAARLVLVPKDMRGPRIICCEPREHQFIQQGLMRLLYNTIEKHPLTRGFVNFEDQQVNRELARLGSVSRNLATIDLKDASDLVRWDVVQELFPSNWVKCLDACRTRYVELPDGTVHGPLSKFAPMGSAVCFPVEALVFWAVLKAHLGVDVWVYGDDMILDSRLVKRATDTLEAFGLRVNHSKCCHLTPFRESCGGEYYSGFDVGYVKYRSFPDSTVESFASHVEFANLANEMYGVNTGRSMVGVVEDLYGPLIRSDRGIPLAYKEKPSSSNDAFFKRRWNRDLQLHEYLIPTVASSKNNSRVGSLHHWGELHRKFCSWDSDHYEVGSYTVPKHCTLKFRWRAV